MLQQFSPLGTTDWGSSITKLKAADADGLFALVPGSDGIAFINQATQFKLFDQYKTVFGFQMLSEPALKALGDKVLGFYGNVGYDVTADNAKNQAFVDGYTKKYGSPPYGVPADHYLAAQMLFEAVQKSKSVDPAKVKAALSGLSFDSFAGPVKVAADHQLVPAGVRRQGRGEGRRAGLRGRGRGAGGEEPPDARSRLQGLSYRRRLVSAAGRVIGTADAVRTLSAKSLGVLAVRLASSALNIRSSGLTAGKGEPGRNPARRARRRTPLTRSASVSVPPPR